MRERIRTYAFLAAAFAVPVDAFAGPAVTTNQTAVLQKAAVQASAFGGPSVTPADAPDVGDDAPAGPAAATQPRAAASGARVEPDYQFTPGKLCTASDPDFQEYRYAENIPYCRRNVTQQMKQEVAAHYGVPQSAWSNYEFDHLIPLAVGGDSHVDNLWPQPHGDPDGSQGKDRLENQLYLEMKAGTITQAGAVKEIYNWFHAAGAFAALRKAGTPALPAPAIATEEPGLPNLQ